MRAIAVVGGGITGLAAAVRLREQAPADTRVIVFEESAALGGKLRTGEFAGGVLERGAEAFLTRDATGGDSPALALARRVGLGDALTHPATTRAAIAVDGRLVPVPPGTLLGVPADPTRVAAIARVETDRDRDEGRPLLEPDEDVAVGALVRRRFGDEVVDRLVDPMLGGVYAGRADHLSLAATMPGLARSARTHATLRAAVQAAQAAAPRATGPVFTTVIGGLTRLVEAAAAASGAEVRCGAAVRELRPTPTGWRLVVEAADTELVDVDAVILAVPARAAAQLVAGVDAVAAGQIGAVDYASMALVSLALPGLVLPELSGFLVPAVEGRLVKAATFFSTKWTHLRRDDGIVMVRASIGRYGEERVLERDDEELVAAVRREIAELVGVPVPTPVATHVQRWSGALPQYPPGHVARVASARERLRAAHPTLALAGAAFDGVGIPLCVRSGESAAEQILSALKGVAR
ncbi:MAG TPA: protoporphyrinogen oxidase [Micromonospora sp.]